MPSRLQESIQEAESLLDKNRDRLPSDFYEQMGYRLRQMNLLDSNWLNVPRNPYHEQEEDFSEAD